VPPKQQPIGDSDLAGANGPTEIVGAVSDGQLRKVCPACAAEYDAGVSFCPRDGSVLMARRADGDLIGQVLAERYHVLKKLGEGGMGQVFLAEHVKMGSVCAIKVMNRGLRDDVDAIMRFGREAANASKINHPHVARVHDYGETVDGLIYLAMEYVPGDSLSTVLKWQRPLPTARAVGIAYQIADALAAAHELGIVHRDLKPDNILVARAREGGDLVKIVDFGIAKAMQGASQTVTRSGFVVGTLQYLSPEQLTGDAVDGRSDLYALGCIMYEMLAGERAFNGPSSEMVITRRLTEPPPSPHASNPDLPKALDAVVVRALARSPAERFQTAEELREALAPFLQASTEFNRRRVVSRPHAETPAAVPGSQDNRSDAVTAPRHRRGPAARRSVLHGRSRVVRGGAAGVGLLVLAALLVQSANREDVPAVAQLPVEEYLPDPSVAVAPVPGEQVRESPVRGSGPVVSTASPPAISEGAQPRSSHGAAEQPRTAAVPAAVTRNPLPTVSSLSPVDRVAGSGAFRLSVRGSGFVAGSLVRWNGAERPTEFVSARELRARISAADVEMAQQARITVSSPAPGGGTSAARSLAITKPPEPEPRPSTPAPAERIPDRMPTPAPEPTNPPEVVVASIRTTISLGRSAAGRADFETAYGALRSAREQLSTLEAQFPRSADVRELAAEHRNALESATKSCQTLRALRVARREPAPQCTSN
jgi:serine/threonine-protein kinase